MRMGLLLCISVELLRKRGSAAASTPAKELAMHQRKQQR